MLIPECCMGLPGKEHSRCWVSRVEGEEAWVGGPWKPGDQAISPIPLNLTGSHDSTGDWSCTAWVLPWETQMHQRAVAKGKGQCAISRTPRCVDSERCLKIGSDWKPAKLPVFPYTVDIYLLISSQESMLYFFLLSTLIFQSLGLDWTSFIPSSACRH